jgi:hypothetical protein
MQSNASVRRRGLRTRSNSRERRYQPTIKCISLDTIVATLNSGCVPMSPDHVEGDYTIDLCGVPFAGDVSRGGIGGKYSIRLSYIPVPDEHNWLARFLNAHPNLWPIVILTAVTWLAIVGLG